MVTSYMFQSIVSWIKIVHQNTFHVQPDRPLGLLHVPNWKTKNIRRKRRQIEINSTSDCNGWQTDFNLLLWDRYCFVGYEILTHRTSVSPLNGIVGRVPEKNIKRIFFKKSLHFVIFCLNGMVTKSNISLLDRNTCKPNFNPRGSFV